MGTIDKSAYGTEKSNLMTERIGQTVTDNQQVYKQPCSWVF